MAVKKKATKKKAAAKATKKKVGTKATKKTTKKATTKKATKKSATKMTTKKATTKAATATTGTAKKAKTKRKPNPAFMQPLTPSLALSTVVGAKPLPRTEVMKKLWAYIKKNNLQHPTNKRNIVADDNLKEVFGGKKIVSMFEMTKLVSQHLS